MKRYLAGAFAFAVLVLIGVPGSSHAATIGVTTTADEYGDGPGCSLREAITAAQTNAAFGGCPAGFGSDTINLPSGEYRITRAGADEDSNATGDFDITGAGDLEIRAGGPEARVTVDGNGIDRVFDKQSVGSLKLTALRITGGKITLIEDGGGIRATVGMTSLEDVTVDGNASAYQAGGIAVYAQLQMINSTVSGNSADGSGGGLYVPGGASLNVRSSTIVSNRADADEDGNGGGGGFADAGAASVNFTNVINAGNSGVSSMPPNQANDCQSGPTFFPRFTLQTQPLGPLDCLVGFGVSNVVTGDAMYGPLRYNGGQTPTHNLLPGSPAIGVGGTAPPDECPGIDQNGVGRPAGSCDIGAVQFVPTPKLGIVRIQPKKKVLRRGKARNFVVVVRNTGTGAATQVRVCLKLNKAGRKGLKRKGKACRKLGGLGIGKVKRPKLRLMAKPRAKKRAYPVRVTVRSANATGLGRTFKVRVK